MGASKRPIPVSGSHTTPKTQLLPYTYFTGEPMKKQKKASVSSEQAVDMLVHNNWTASSDHLTIITPLTLFYKIRDEKTGKLLHAAVYPGAMSCDYQPNNAALHQHDHFELMYVLDGELTNKIERISYTYKKGDACLLNRNTRHTDIPGQRCSVVFINFHAQYILELMEKDVLFELSPQITPPGGAIHDFLRSNLQGEERFARNYLEFSSTLHSLAAPSVSPAETIIDQLQQEMVSARPGYSYLLRGLLLRLFYTLEDKTSFHCNFMRLDSSNEDFLFARISNCLEESHGNISRPELSRALHYNAEYLNQIVKRRTGASLLKLAGQYRLDHARQLLTKTDKSVTAIVEELGFSGTSHFYNLFRRETGMSPLEYRGKNS